MITNGSRLTPVDLGLLTWYFGLGMTAFERSTMGPMLDRAELYGSAGERVWDGEQFQVVTSRLTYSATITARPTAETHGPGGYTPSRTDLERYADASRRLVLLGRADGLAPVVIEAYFGDAAEVWAKTKLGRIGAVYHLTASGVRMIEVAEARASETARKVRQEAAKKKKKPLDPASEERILASERQNRLRLTLAQRMRTTVLAAGAQGKLRDGLIRTDREAEQLFAQACESWNAVSRSR